MAKKKDETTTGLDLSTGPDQGAVVEIKKDEDGVTIIPWRERLTQRNIPIPEGA
jgi:hypothetical protein